MNHHKEGTIVFYEGKNRDTYLFRMRHDHDEPSENTPKSEQIMQITKSDAWKPELSAKVVTFFKDMVSRYAKGELTKEQVQQEKGSFMTQAVMPIRRPNKAKLRKGILAKPAASDTVVPEAAKPAAKPLPQQCKEAANKCKESANKRQKVTALVEVAAIPAWTSHSEGPCAATNESAGTSHSEGPGPRTALLTPDVPPPPDVFSDIF